MLEKINKVQSLGLFRTIEQRVQSDSDRQRVYRILVLGIVVLGVAVRLSAFLAGRSLWLDESFLALNIIDRSMPELLKPLDYNQSAPLGFLVTVKAITQITSTDEIWLRTLPFVSGLASLFLFVIVARDYLGKRALLVGLFLLAASERVIYYSSELKQYSTDVLASLICLGLATYLVCRPNVDNRQFAAIAFMGALMPWLSLPASILLGSGALIIIASAAIQRDRRRMVAHLLIAFTWCCSVAANLLYSLANLEDRGALQQYWESGFLPPITSQLALVRWLAERPPLLVEYTTGIGLAGLGVLALTVGALVFLKETKARFALLTLPLALVLIAASLRLYPLDDRLTLFLAPIITILVAKGSLSIAEALEARIRLAGVLFLILLLATPLIQLISLMNQPTLHEELLPVLSGVRDEWRDGDHVYVYYGAIPAFQYYRQRLGFDQADYTEGIMAREEPQAYAGELRNLIKQGGRTWLVFSHVHESDIGNEMEFFLSYFETLGIMPLEFIHDVGADAYLYNLGP